jgi:sec-independent protein translocase protein TatA
MGSMSLAHWAIVLAVVLLLFGGTKVSSLMADFGNGLKTFRKAVNEPDEPPPALAQDPKVAPIAEARFAERR